MTLKPHAPVREGIEAHLFQGYPPPRHTPRGVFRGLTLGGTLGKGSQRLVHTKPCHCLCFQASVAPAVEVGAGCRRGRLPVSTCLNLA